MKRNDNFILRQTERGNLLTCAEGSCNPLHGKITMSESAAVIWNLLAVDQSLEQLVSAMTREYDVTPEVAEQDIQELLKVMKKLKLVVAS